MRHISSTLFLAPVLLTLAMAQAPKADNSKPADKPSTLSAVTGCLSKGADGVYTMKNQSGDQFTVTGPSELERHVSHKVTLRGVEETKNGRMIFKADTVEMISTDCSTAGR